MALLRPNSNYLLQHSKVVQVVGNGKFNDAVRFFSAIYVGNFTGHFFARQVFVSQKIVLQTIYNGLGQIADVVVLAIDEVVFQNGDNFVVGLALIE